jgi:hypothetical protein
MSRLRADNYTDQAGTGPPNFPNGINLSGGIDLTSLNSSGIVTGSSFNSSGIITGSSFRGDGSLLTGVITSVDFISGIAATFTGDVSIGGALTYEDVSNVDAVGVVTAQVGVRILTGGVIVNAGVSTFAADISIADKIIHTGDTNTAIRFPAADTFTVETGGSEAHRVDSSQRLLVGRTASVLDNIGGTGYANLVQIEGAATGSGLGVGNTAGPSRINITRKYTPSSGDDLGYLSFGAEVGSTVERARITCQSEFTNANARGGRLIFSTSGDGAHDPTERFRIESSGTSIFGGNTQIGGASYGNVNGLLIEPAGGIRATNDTTSYHLFRGYTTGNASNTSSITADGSATFSTVTDSIGPLRRLGVNAQSGAYAFVVGDAGKIIRSSGSGSALTLNQNIFTAGDMISVFNVGSGNNTVVQGTGVTLYNAADAATGTRTIAAKGMCTIVCTASNEFAISGSQLS